MIYVIGVICLIYVIYVICVICLICHDILLIIIYRGAKPVAALPGRLHSIKNNYVIKLQFSHGYDTLL